MKKNYLLGVMAAGMLLFTACSNDENIANDADTQTFVLKVASSGDGVTSRAGRPLGSSEAKQEIQNVKIIVCNMDDEIKFVRTIDDWNGKGSTEYSTEGHGREKTIEIPKDSKLEPGEYKVYAFGFGYSNGSDYDLNEIIKITDGTTTGTFKENITLPFKTGAGNTIGEEIFAGDYKLTVKLGKGFKTPVVLNRQVAGTFGYLKDIPYLKDAAKLRLIATAKNNQLVLGEFGNHDLQENGTGNGEHINYVVNGADAADEEVKVIYEIVLKDKWFTEIKDGNNDGIIDVEDNWIGDSQIYAVGSVFAGEFLIPFSKSVVEGTNTFTLQLTDADDKELRSWTVKLPGGDGQLDKHTLCKWDGEKFVSTQNNEDTNTNYNVVRNHLYGIGKRAVDDPTDPGTDTDVPESLNTKQELILKVNDNWEVIHNMDLE